MSEIKPPLKCSECDFSSSYQCHVDSHLQSVHEGKKHLCPYCDAIYSRKNTLNDHIKTFHRSISQDLSNGVKNEIDNKICLTKPFQCLNCSESFVSKYDLNIHNKSVHEGELPNKCPDCGYSSARKENLRRHIKTQHEGKDIYLYKKKKSLLCTLCDTEFKDLPSFKKHFISVHDGQKPHKCSLCDRGYYLERSLDNHISIIHKGTKKYRKRDYLCQICNKIFDSKLKFIKHNVVDHEEKKPYPCTLCDEAYLQSTSLKQHVASVHEGVRYDCTLCDSNFTIQASLRKHMDQVHEKKRPYLCTVCGSSSKTKQALGLHIAAVHEGKKPHMCSICGFSFAARFSLLHHMRVVHEKRKPYSCPMESCDYTAAIKSSLKKHVEKHGGVKPYGCPLCDTRFYDKYKQKQHISAVHDKVKPLNCPYCPKTFSRNYHLKTHLKSHNIIE